MQESKQKFEFLEKISQQNKMPLLLGGVVAGALGLWVVGKIIDPWVSAGCKVYLERDSQRPSYADRVEKIEAVRVKPGKITRRISAVGKLQANASILLKSEIPGRIREIHVKDGQEVAQGDLLIEFADENQKAELEQAKAEFVKAEADFKRISSLRDRNIESIKKFDEAKAAVDIYQARVDKANAELRRARIEAPFAGTIGLIKVDNGAYVQAAQDLVTLVDNTPINVEFKIPEKYLSDIGVGQSAEIKLDSFPNETFKATLDALDAVVDEVSHSIAARATIANDDGRLKEGLFANISLIIGEKSNSLLIPESALARDGNIEYVFVVQGGKAGRRRVVTGTRENGQVEILQGLRPDELVVTAGQTKLGEGTTVEVTNLPNPENMLDDIEEKNSSDANSKNKEEKQVADKTSDVSSSNEKQNDEAKSAAESEKSN